MQREIPMLPNLTSRTGTAEQTARYTQKMRDLANYATSLRITVRNSVDVRPVFFLNTRVK